MNKCKVCGKRVCLENGIQCLNSETWFHFMCLDCDECTVQNIRAGLFSALRKRRPCAPAKCIQADLEEDICADDDSEDECEYQNLTPVITLNKPRCKRRVRVQPSREFDPCERGCDHNTDYDDDDDNSDDCYQDEDEDEQEKNKEREKDKNKEPEKKKGIEKQKEKGKETDRQTIIEKERGKEPVLFDASKKWCPKSPIDFSDDIMAEEKHQCDKDTLSMKLLFVNKKTQHDCSKLKRVRKNEDLMKIKEEKETPISRCKSTPKSALIGSKTSVSSVYTRPGPRSLDESVIEVLENVCHTAKQLHIQLRELMCKMVKKSA